MCKNSLQKKAKKFEPKLTDMEKLIGPQRVRVNFSRDMSKIETDRFHSFLNRYRYFRNFFYRFWPTADNQLTTDTDILKFAY